MTTVPVRRPRLVDVICPTSTSTSSATRIGLLPTMLRTDDDGDDVRYSYFFILRVLLSACSYLLQDLEEQDRFACSYSYDALYIWPRPPVTPYEDLAMSIPGRRRLLIVIAIIHIIKCHKLSMLALRYILQQQH